ncbi:hypothetical protein Scep_016354 [Stephania cephalantha]|uniref:Uncharacterized protein n=1 Tax=Stephania cephalantha TaxID=152367 RepID=A0AAP0IP86_9MAGN
MKAKTMTVEEVKRQRSKATLVFHSHLISITLDNIDDLKKGLLGCHNNAVESSHPFQQGPLRESWMHDETKSPGLLRSHGHTVGSDSRHGCQRGRLRARGVNCRRYQKGPIKGETLLENPVEGGAYTRRAVVVTRRQIERGRTDRALRAEGPPLGGLINGRAITTLGLLPEGVMEGRGDVHLPP